MTFRLIPILSYCLLWNLVCSLQGVEVIEPARHHLGIPNDPEWDIFVDKSPEGMSLNLEFTIPVPVAESVLFIRQEDVKGNWEVFLNQTKMGKLQANELDLWQTFRIPEGILRPSGNKLLIEARKQNPPQKDDIILGEILYSSRPYFETMTECAVAVSVIDEANGKPMPARLTIVDENGSLAPVFLEDAIQSAVRPGVVYTSNGNARIGLLPGRYEIIASRGFEYSLSRTSINLRPGQSQSLKINLHQEVNTDGLLSCDPHIHVLDFSGHGDATALERMATIAGEQIEIAIATDHNHHTDFKPFQDRLHLNKRFTSVIGNEVTTSKGHFNIFPIDADSPIPDFKITNWPRLMESMRSVDGVQVVLLNHPRNIHSAFSPMAKKHFNRVTGHNRRGAEFRFDAIEVITSAALQADLMGPVRDWFALLNYGLQITAVGSSDSHDVNRYLIGQGRTYLFAEDSDPSKVDINEVCESFLKGKALVSMGLLATLTVDREYTVGDIAGNLGTDIRVESEIRSPSWSQAERVDLYANGKLIRSTKLDRVRRTQNSVKVVWQLDKPAHDVHLVVVASGPGIQEAFWNIPRPYQHESIHWKPEVMAVTNPVRLDVDGDGHFTSAREYALNEWNRVDGNLNNFLRNLEAYGTAVRTQAAGILIENDLPITDPKLQSLLKTASKETLDAFESVAEAIQR